MKTVRWPEEADRGSNRDTAELVEAYFDAISRQALSADLYTDSAVLHYTGGHGLAGDYVGYEQMQQMFAQSAAAFPGPLVLRARQTLTGGPYGAALIDASVVGEDDAFEWLRVVVFRFAEGRIAEQWLFDSDSEGIAAVLSNAMSESRAAR